jgi:hypothetical protein
MDWAAAFRISRTTKMRIVKKMCGMHIEINYTTSCR